MARAPAHFAPVLLLALTLTLSTAAAAPAGRLQLAAQPGGKQVVCEEIEQRLIVQQSQLNSRALNFLLFDAAERGCLELAQRFLDLGASVKARDRAGNTALSIAARMGEAKVVDR